jgi:hypothetical protein
MNAHLNKYLDLCRSTFAVRPTSLSYLYLIFHTSNVIGISTKTLWDDAFSCVNLSKMAKKPPDTEGSSFSIF